MRFRNIISRIFIFFIINILFYLNLTKQNYTLSDFKNDIEIDNSLYAEIRNFYNKSTNIFEQSSTQKLLTQIQSEYQFKLNNLEDCQNLPTNVNFNSLQNIWLCLNSKTIVLKCKIEWQLLIGCGTYLELHRPFNGTVIVKRSLEKTDDLSRPINMAVTNVCAGTYHLWFVYVTRIGKIIKYVVPVFITYPDCATNLIKQT